MWLHYENFIILDVRGERRFESDTEYLLWIGNCPLTTMESTEDGAGLGMGGESFEFSL